MKYSWIVSLVIGLSLALWSLPDQPKTIESENVIPFTISVYGAVNRPNTWTFYMPVTFEELIIYAGGYAENADTYVPNTHTFQTDTIIQIPFKSIEEDEQIIKININTASFETLLTIPYMTETRAAELIIYRTQHGPFETIDAIIHVKYIGQATLENLRPYIKVE